MSDWNILPAEGMSMLRLGDDRAAVRQRLGSAEPFRRTPTAPEARRGRRSPVLDHFACGLFVTYDPKGKVIFIEITWPARPTIGGVTLLGRSLTAVLHDLSTSTAGLHIVRDRAGASIQEWRVGLYAPTGIVEGVSIGAD